MEGAFFYDVGNDALNYLAPFIYPALPDTTYENAMVRYNIVSITPDATPNMGKLGTVTLPGGAFVLATTMARAPISLKPAEFITFIRRLCAPPRHDGCHT